MQSGNLTDDLKARGLASVDTVNRIYDVDPALGGPIKKDVLWFFGSVRVWKTDQNIAGQFYNLNPAGSHVYTPDLSRPAFEGDRDGNQSLRLTWRASPKNKISAQFQNNQQIRDHFYGQGTANRLLAPDAIIYYNARPSYLGQVGWNAPVTNRLLLEGGVSLANKDFHYYPAAGSRLRRAVLDRVVDEHSLGQHAERRRVQRQPQLERAVGRVVRHRFARREVRHQLPARELVQHDRAVQQRHHLHAAERTAAFGDASMRRRSRATDVNKANIGLFGQDQWTMKRVTHQCGRALRLLQRVRAGAASRPRSAGADAQRRFRRRSTTFPTGRMCRRVSACPTTCSATARRPSRPASAGTCRPIT